MARFCEYCGAELLNGTLICSQCGAVLSGDAYTQPDEPQSIQNPAEVQDQMPEPAVQHEPQETATQPKKKKKWLIPVVAVAAVAVLVVAGLLLWQPVLKTVAPDVYVGMMLNNTNIALENRLEDTPADVASSVSDSLDEGSLGIDVTYWDDNEGLMKGSITLHSNMKDQKWRLDADVSAMGTDADFSAYLDSNAFAIGSNALTGGKFYGLTYNSFENDLRSSAFAEMLDEESITALTDVVESVDKTLDTVANLEKRLVPYIQLLTEYADGLETKSGSEKLELSGQDCKCSTVSYLIKQDELVDMIGQLLDLLEKEEEIQDLDELLETSGAGSVAEIMDELRNGLDEVNETIETEAVLTYYIYDSKVVDIRFVVTVKNSDTDEEVEAEINICYGANPEVDDIVINADAEVAGETISIKVVSSDSWDGDEYTGTVTMSAKASSEMLAEIKQKTVWNKKSGDLTLSVSSAGEKIDCSLTLMETENGCVIEIPDVYRFLCELSPDFTYVEPFKCEIKVTVAEGNSIEVPTFTNLDKIDQTVLEELMADVEAFVGDNSEIIGSLGGAFEDDAYGDDYYEDIYEDDYFEDDYFEDDYEDVVIEDIWD